MKAETVSYVLWVFLGVLGVLTALIVVLTGVAFIVSQLSG